jgi:predicted MPP superfamily phosphohydrolase
MLFGQNKMLWRGSPSDWLRDTFMGGTGTPMMMRQNIFLPKSKWPADYPSLTIAILTDLHIGCPAMTLERLEKVVERINAENPDLILLIGDYTNKGRWNGPFIEPDIFAKNLGRLRARYGVFATKGNHDNRDDPEGVKRAFTENGIPLLENDAVKIGHNGNRTWLVGLPDELTDKVDLKKAFEKVTTRDPVLVMAHNPRTFFKLGPRVTLTMSGHNHGGQCRLPGIGAIYLPGSAPLKYAYGHIRENGSDLFIGPGLGTSNLPIRTFCPAGVPLLTLRTA